jgi:hypothetical protein
MHRRFNPLTAMGIAAASGSTSRKKIIREDMNGFGAA